MLDHIAFPHILDRVLEHSPPDVLLAFRTTSRGVRARVDRLLHHVSVTMSEVFKDGRKDREVTLSAKAWSARFPRPDKTHLSNHEIFRLLVADRRLMMPVLGLAAVVDIYGPLSYNLPTVGADPFGVSWVQYGKVDTLRLFPDADGVLASPLGLTADTVVVFGGAATGGWPINYVQLGGDEPLVVNIPVVLDQDVAQWFSDIGHVRVLWGPHSYRQAPSSWTADVVFVFHTFEADEVEMFARTRISDVAGQEGVDDLADDDINKDGGWLSLTTNLQEMAGARSLTFVGFPPRMRNGKRVVGPNYLRKMVAEVIVDEGAVDEVRSPPQFLSHRDYADAVGAEAYSLHTGAGALWRWPHSAAPAIEDNAAPRWTRAA